MTATLRGRVVVVTGASSGIGRATALRFAERGATVVLAARHAGALEQVAVQCRERGGRAFVVPTDVTDERSGTELARVAVDRAGGLDVWVNNAGVSVWGRIDEVPLADVRRILDTNVLGYVLGIRAALPQFRAQGQGVIINNASMFGVLSEPYGAAYVLTKHAVRGLSMALRQELAVDGVSGIRVCTVLPAAMDTPIFQHGANYTGRRVLAPPPVYPAEKVAAAIVRSAVRPRREVYVGFAGWQVVQLAKIAPGLAERVLAILADRRQLSAVDPAEPTSGNLYRPLAAEGDGVQGGWNGRRQATLRRVAGAAAGAAAVAGAVTISRRSGRDQR